MSTEIQWTDETWNPVTGCTKVSPGCKHCYAEGVAERFFAKQYQPIPIAFGQDGQVSASRPRVFTDVQTHEDRLVQPFHWRKPRKIFVNSMSDLFHEDVPDFFIAQVFSVMAWARQHTFQILTKRHTRMYALLSSAEFRAEVAEFVDFWLHDDPEPPPALRWDPNERRTDDARAMQPDIEGADWPLPNVWLGVSVENQRYADERIPLLLKTPAAVRFISAEPLLGPIDLNGLPDPQGDPSWDASALHGVRECAFGATVSREKINRLDWAIFGGESGPGARPSEIEWYRSLLKQCKAAGVAAFMKQLGRDPRGFCSWPHHDEKPPAILDRDGVLSSISGEPGSLCHAVDDAYWPCSPRLKDKKGGDMAEWPEDLRVREFPR